ncbi:DUF4956 domain-containing protein [Novosphingobium soli]|uniref:DUF4956 domain-containing protein n=1 Tax=Novosphingobium soli TaxID=574956 RepID=A0ABV6CXS6_9SPHN
MIAAMVGPGALSDLMPLLVAALLGCMASLIHLLVQRGDRAAMALSCAGAVIATAICLITRVVSDLPTAFIVVGALTLVRLRAAIEDVREFGFLLVCVAIGLGCGEERYGIVAAGAGLTCLLGVLLVPGRSRQREHRITVTLLAEQAAEFSEWLRNAVKDHRLSLRNLGEGRMRLRVTFSGAASAADPVLRHVGATWPSQADLQYTMREDD